MATKHIFALAALVACSACNDRVQFHLPRVSTKPKLRPWRDGPQATRVVPSEWRKSVQPATGRTMRFYHVKGMQVWGDYGDVLVNGLVRNNLDRRASDSLKLTRAGPFMPPITFQARWFLWLLFRTGFARKCRNQVSDNGSFGRFSKTISWNCIGSNGIVVPLRRRIQRAANRKTIFPRRTRRRQPTHLVSFGNWSLAPVLLLTPTSNSRHQDSCRLRNYRYVSTNRLEWRSESSWESNPMQRPQVFGFWFLKLERNGWRNTRRNGSASRSVR